MIANIAFMHIIILKILIVFLLKQNIRVYSCSIVIEINLIMKIYQKKTKKVCMIMPQNNTKKTMTI